MVVMPVWKGQLAVQSRDGSAGLWHEFIPEGATPLRAAIQAVRTVSAVPLYCQFLRVWPAPAGLNSGARITVSIAVCEDSHVLHSISGGRRKNCLVEKHGIGHISKVCRILESGVVMVKGQFSRWSLVWRVMCPHSSHLQRTVPWSGIWRPRLARMGFFRGC